MSLVDYSDSETEPDYVDDNAGATHGFLSDHAETGTNGSLAAKAQVPPPLPKNFHTLYSTAVRSSNVDDPTLHAGRLRQTPHIEGNWPTHVYLEWFPSPSELTWLEEVLGFIEAQAGSSVQSLLYSSLGARLPLHISLSAPLILQIHQRQDFVAAIERRLVKETVGSFVLSSTGLEWLANEDETRHFLVLRFARPSKDELNKLLCVCNVSAQEFGLPVLYDQRQPAFRSGETNTTTLRPDNSYNFHVSIAWQLSAPTTTQKNALATLNSAVRVEKEIVFGILYIKVGNTVSQLPLK